jgi:hypothetical protein
MPPSYGESFCESANSARGDRQAEGEARALPDGGMARALLLKKRGEGRSRAAGAVTHRPQYRRRPVEQVVVDRSRAAAGGRVPGKILELLVDAFRG